MDTPNETTTIRTLNKFDEFYKLTKAITVFNNLQLLSQKLDNFYAELDDDGDHSARLVFDVSNCLKNQIEMLDAVVTNISRGILLERDKDFLLKAKFII